MRKKNIVPISLLIISKDRTIYLYDLLKYLLRQTVYPSEIIVIDYPNNRLIKELVNKINNKYPFIIHYLHQRKPGLPAAKNLAIKKARQDIIAFLDDDCIPINSWLENIYKSFSKTKYDIVVGKNLNAKPDNIVSVVIYYLTTRSTILNIYKKDLLLSRFTDLKNFAMKKIIVKKVGYFDKKLNRVDDVDFSIRLNLKRIPIFYNRQMVIQHMHYSDLWSLVRNLFVIGRDKYILKLKWKRLYKQQDNINYKYKDVLFDMYKQRMKEKSSKFEKEFINRYYRKKSVLWKFGFKIFKNIGFFFLNLGNYYGRIYNLKRVF